MAAKQSKLIALIKYFWDNHWKDKNVLLILCGSIASFMIDKVIKSKALYGRIRYEILLRPLKPNECLDFFRGKKNKEEILKYLMIFGAIPKYLEIINLRESFKQNIEKLCFKPEGYLVEEFEKIFYNQFKEAKNYIKIVNLLKEKMYTLQEISQKLSMPVGGGLQRYITALEKAQIITGYLPSHLILKSKNKKYRVIDEYLSFYFKYIKPNLAVIKKPDSRDLFQKLCTKQWTPWLGFAFERFILKNAIYVADIMGFGDEVIDYAPYFAHGEQKFQIDLVYVRADSMLTVVEIKYHDSEIGTAIIPEVERKINLLKIPKNHSVNKALISLRGPDKHLKDSRYFDYAVGVEDLFNF